MLTTAQTPLFSPFVAEAELSSRHILCFFQDRRGFLWIGTENGLNFYNAATVKKYKHDGADKTSLLNNWVQRVCEDGEGNIWASTETGIARLNTASQRFAGYTTDDKGAPLGYKCKAFSDREGNIWVAGDGLFRLDKGKNVFQKINAANGLRLNGFLEDRHHRIWLSSFNGLYLFERQPQKLIRFDAPPTDPDGKKYGIIFMPAYEDGGGDLWVGTWGYGFFKILPGENRLQLVHPGNCFTYAAQELNGRAFVWYAAGGLQRYGKREGSREPLSYLPGNAFSPRADEVSALFTDRQGQLWLGYNSQGVQVLNPANQLVRTHFLQGAKATMRSVNAFAPKGDELVLGGWYQSAACKVNRDGAATRWWHHLPSGKTGPSSNVSDFYFDRKGALWASTFNGLVCLEGGGKESAYTFDTAVSKNNRFLDILPEGDSVLWLSGYDNGLTRFSLQTKSLLRVRELGKSLLWKIDADDKGNVWCADNAGALLCYQKSGGKISRFAFDSLTGQSIFYDVKYQSSANRLYAATGNGLLRVEAASMKAVLFTEKDGLPASNVNSLEWQDGQRLWIGTSEGLSLFDTKKEVFQNFGTAAGLFTERIEHGLQKTGDGRLLIGMDGGYMELNTAALPPAAKALPVVITSVSEGDSLLQPQPATGAKVITLPYNRNNLRFEIAMPDYVSVQDNHLSYQLQGWDKTFLPTKTGVVVYQKLLPGRYVFNVKGLNHSGVESTENDSVVVVIEPPFWKRSPFIGSLTGAFLFLFFIVVRYVSQRNLKERLLRLEKEQAIEKERNRISRDMHDDLGSGLTKIAIMSEVVKKQLSEPGKAVQQLENISATSRELVDSLQDIIWTLNPQHDTAQSLSEYLKEYAAKFFESLGIDVNFTVSVTAGPVKLSEECRRAAFLTAKESFNNAAKHARCKTVAVTFAQAAAAVSITIADDGFGFSPGRQKPFRNGLHNAALRMKAVNGTYTIRSQHGSGTTVIITCPCTTN